MPAHAHAQRASPAARQPDRVEGHGHRLLLRRSHARPLDLGPGPGPGRAEESSSTRAAPASLSAQAQRRAWQWQTSTTVGDRLALAGWPGGDKRGCDRGAQPPVACSPDLSRSQRACLLVPERGRTHHTHMAGRASRQSRLALPQHTERERG